MATRTGSRYPQARPNFVCAFAARISFAWVKRKRSQKLNQAKKQMKNTNQIQRGLVMTINSTLAFVTVAVAAGLAVLPMLSKAASIDVYNTGVNNSSPPSTATSLPGGSLDPHWTVSFGGVPSGPALVLGPSSLGLQWTPDSAASAWIGITTNVLYRPKAAYTFSETFSLSSLNAANPVLSGKLWGDANVTLELNGHAILTASGDNTGLSWTVNDVGADHGWFNSGQNTLSILMISDDPYNNGVRLQVNGTAAGVPDTASSVSLLGLALLGTRAVSRRFKNTM